MRILKVEPGKAPEVKEIEDKLESIQAEVEGFFEIVDLEDSVILCCNDEGKLNGMAMNRRVGDDIICGPFFLVGDDGEGNFRSLTEKEVQKYTDRFRNPEQFSDYEEDAQPRMLFMSWG